MSCKFPATRHLSPQVIPQSLWVQNPKKKHNNIWLWTTFLSSKFSWKKCHKTMGPWAISNHPHEIDNNNRRHERPAAEEPEEWLKILIAWILQRSKSIAPKICHVRLWQYGKKHRKSSWVANHRIGRGDVWSWCWWWVINKVGGHCWSWFVQLVWD